MPVTYQPAPLDVVARAQRLMEAHHPHLIENEVKVDIVMAFGPVNEDGEKTGPALRLNGYECLGIASITKLKERVKGDGDCEIALDGDRWPNLSELERDSLVDHELTHFLMFKTEDGQKYDDLGRPMLTMRLHDFDVGWFHCIAQRYGMAAGEVRQFVSLCQSEDGPIYTQHLATPGDRPTMDDFEIMLARLVWAAKTGKSEKIGPVLALADDLLRRRGRGSPLRYAEAIKKEGSNYSKNIPPSEKASPGRSRRQKTMLERARRFLKELRRLGFDVEVRGEQVRIPVKQKKEVPAELLIEFVEVGKVLPQVLKQEEKAN